MPNPSDTKALANAVRAALTPDLLRPAYRGHADNPLYGHCYVASEALFHLLGGRDSGYSPCFGKDDHGVTHWWLEDPLTGDRLDITADQYYSVGREPPYAARKSGGFLTNEPSKRARIVMSRVHPPLPESRRSVKKTGEDGARSTSGHPPENAGSSPAPRSTPELYLEVCSEGDSRYKAIVARHYVHTEKVKGTHGQQIHFLIWYKGECVGIITGASAVFATLPRDLFFRISGTGALRARPARLARPATPTHAAVRARGARPARPATGNRVKCLNGIIDNTLFRLELHEKNLGSRVLSLWEKSVVWMWEHLYEVKVFGFETFILREGKMAENTQDLAAGKIRLIPDPEGVVRHGSMYRAAGWSYAGRSAGRAKAHDGVSLTGSWGKDGKGHFLTKETTPKEVYCKWVPGFSVAVESDYKPSWKAAVKGNDENGNPIATPEMKARAKRLSALRRELLGTRFFREGKALIYENLKQTVRGRIEWNAPRAAAKIRRSTMRPSSSAPTERENLRETETV